MKQIIKSITKKLALLSLAGLLIGQSAGYLAQKLMVENNIRERVRDALSKIVDNKKPKIRVLNSSKKEIKTQKLNYKKIIKDLKWKQNTNLTQGLKKTIAWYKANEKQISTLKRTYIHKP